MQKITFPRSRVNTFNDAIFSIAITLLVLQIHVPGTEEIKEMGIWAVLQKMIPDFSGFLVSFMVIAIYWISHMKMARFVKEYDNKLLWLNIFLLFFTAFLPFSTAFYVRNFNLTGPFVLYCLNIILLGFFNFLMILNIIKNATPALDGLTAKWLKFRPLNGVIIWTCSLLLAFVLPGVARIFFILIFINQAIAERYFRRKKEASK